MPRPTVVRKEDMTTDCIIGMRNVERNELLEGLKGFLQLKVRNSKTLKAKHLKNNASFLHSPNFTTKGMYVTIIILSHLG